MGPVPHALARLQTLALITAVAIFSTVAAISLATGAWAGGVTVLGAGPAMKPSCPDVNERCIVEARVTGFQTHLGNTKKPFVARTPSRIVAWSIKLGRPTAKDNKCLSDGCTVGSKKFAGFGGPARARVAVLKPIRSKIKAGKPVYELVRQSPTEELTPFFGTTTTFTLGRPLGIKKGQIVALTIPTWAPMFVFGLNSDYAWRASRAPTKKRGGCTVGTPPNQGANVKAGSPHQAVGKTRRYACVYKTNRLLYSATMVPRPGGGK